MDNKPPLDYKGSSNHNQSQMIDEGLELINLEGRKPLNDPNCQHPNVVRDGTEELGTAFQCSDCNIGWIVSPS